MATSATQEKVHYDSVDAIPLGEINVANPYLFQNDTVGEYFTRLRREDPVHYCAESRFGPYWSVTKFNDIMAVDTNHKVFSSEAKLGGIAVQDMHGIEGALGWLHVGKVPVLVLLVLFLLGFALCGYAVQLIARGVFGAAATRAPGAAIE